MYCKKCGKKAPSGAKVCECGAVLQIDEYCNGFWGLVGKEPSAAPPSNPRPQETPHQPGESPISGRPKRKAPPAKHTYLFPLVALVLRITIVILLVVCLCVLNGLKDRMTEDFGRMERICQKIYTEMAEENVPELETSEDQLPAGLEDDSGVPAEGGTEDIPEKESFGQQAENTDDLTAQETDEQQSDSAGDDAEEGESGDSLDLSSEPSVLPLD